MDERPRLHRRRQSHEHLQAAVNILRMDVHLAGPTKLKLGRIREHYQQPDTLFSKLTNRSVKLQKVVTYAKNRPWFRRFEQSTYGRADTFKFGPQYLGFSIRMNMQNVSYQQTASRVMFLHQLRKTTITSSHMIHHEAPHLLPHCCHGSHHNGSASPNNGTPNAVDSTAVDTCSTTSAPLSAHLEVAGALAALAIVTPIPTSSVAITSTAAHKSTSGTHEVNDVNADVGNLTISSLP
ncbi:hypothetical protein BU25DRAFT_448033 [Macroventuria anomochaeta]|uniref:Uncharacterized protein n=1 Tax=Macroventuria anomochaeta TaxID=301207 RepID=A0ACB6S1W5_9PLEO|nr:uncharacterized protein BU25DRAFT_448033 [Macroventuria anomochaeta]KAF2628023.1 hypothetical protein BU25DRAFT_448033 [Macroventuria anomochaeta]